FPGLLSARDISNCQVNCTSASPTWHAVRSPCSPTSCTASLSEAYSVVHRLCVPYLTARATAIIPFSRSSIPLRRGWRSCRAAYICWETCAWPLRAPLNPGALVGTLPAHQVVSSAVLWQNVIQE